MRILEGVPLAPRTTLRLGGPARRFAEVESERDVALAVGEADARGERVLVLGGGSNVVIGDAGFDGLVVGMELRGVNVARGPARGEVRVEAAAGEGWDALVQRCVEDGLAGLECLAGIPGRVGATPIQNVGAYGQEVSDTLVSVRVFDRATRALADMSAAACAFGYRRSVFKGGHGAGRFVVVSVTYALSERRVSANVRYAELARALGVPEGGEAPIDEVRRTVIALRRAKGMVVDAADPDSVSAGSFFVNPVLDDAGLAALEARVRVRLGPDARAPRFAAGAAAEGGAHKVSAGWLIEQAGFRKGLSSGAVGISTKHALALVNRGGATARELLDFAAVIQRGVHEAFGVALSAEPVVVDG
jgi:UDP-N-acetylmuramate dehydrogenase